MKVAVFSTQDYEKSFFDKANEKHHHSLTYYEEHLSSKTAFLAKGFDAVCCFVNDTLNEETLNLLAQYNIACIALRSAGYNHVNLPAAKKNNITVARVPAYSPYAVAEHAVGLILMLNRHLHRAYNRVREHDFSLKGLMGFDLHGATVGIIGTGNIGCKFAHIMAGFGCKLMGYDPVINEECVKHGVIYVKLPVLFQHSDIISLHCPLTPETFHLINEAAIAQMKPHVMLINTSRGAVLDTKAVIKGLKQKKIGYLGIDVYEEEEHLFFENLSDDIIQDDTFARLQTFPNVVITGHQAFFTKEAVSHIAETTLENLSQFEKANTVLYPVSSA